VDRASHEGYDEAVDNIEDSGLFKNRENLKALLKRPIEAPYRSTVGFDKIQKEYHLFVFQNNELVATSVEEFLQNSPPPPINQPPISSPHISPVSPLYVSPVSPPHIFPVHSPHISPVPPLYVSPVSPPHIFPVHSPHISPVHSPVGSPHISLSNSPLPNSLPINQSLDNQPLLNQSPLNSPPPINQPPISSLHISPVHSPLPNSLPINQSLDNQPLLNQSPLNSPPPNRDPDTSPNLISDNVWYSSTIFMVLLIATGITGILYFWEFSNDKIPPRKSQFPKNQQSQLQKIPSF